MGATRAGVLGSVLLAACLPKPEPAEPVQPYPQPPAYPPQSAPAPYQQPAPAPTPHASEQAAQPVPQQPPPQPYPPPVQTAQPYPPPAQTAQPYPPPAQPYAPPAQPYPPPAQPYAPQGYAPQPAYYGAPYPPPPAYPPPPPMVISEGRQSHFHDGEVIFNFAAVGTLGAISFLSRADVEDSNAISFALIGGLAGGGGVGYLLTQKYDVTGGAARSTTLGLVLGIANGALLLEPTGWDRTESVLNLLFVGSALGAGGGFLYGQTAKLTAGQATFVGNMMLVGTATASLGAITGSRDGAYGGSENAVLALGVNGGAVAGAIIAPSLDWSPRRARTVLAATVIGAFAGGMMTGLIAKPDDGEASDANGNLVAATMTAGLWGGFALGVLMTKENAPDPKFRQQKTQTASAAPTAFAPWIGGSGHVGMMAGGSF